MIYTYKKTDEWHSNASANTKGCDADGVYKEIPCQEEESSAAYSRDECGWRIGPPKAGENHTVAEMESMGLVGLYKPVGT